MFWLADLVLAIHFALAAFVASGLLLIPMGAICHWQWVRNRIFHSVSFLWLYMACAVWVMCLWWYCPPISDKEH